MLMWPPSLAPVFPKLGHGTHFANHFNPEAAANQALKKKKNIAGATEVDLGGIIRSISIKYT